MKIIINMKNIMKRITGVLQIKEKKISGVTEENVIEELDFKIGVPGKHDDEINNKKYDFQTCGVPSKSLCSFWTGTPKGGKKTKKKRKSKRTHKKKNAHKKRKTHNKRKN